MKIRVKKAYATDVVPFNNLINKLQESQREKGGAGSLFKDIMAENFPNLGGEMNTQVYEEKRSPYIFNLKSHRDTFMWNLFKKITPKTNVIMEKTNQMVEW